MNTLYEEIWLSIIDGDWRIYRGLLAIPEFARLVMKDPYRWRRFLTVVTQGNEGSYVWTLADRIHREDDLPAICNAFVQRWYRHGESHRDGDQPAVITANGDQIWSQRGKIHRDGDQPAIIRANETRVWYQHGNRHRDRQPAVIYADKTQEWWVNGKMI